MIKRIIVHLGEMNPDVSIHKVTGRQSEVTYRPSLRDQARFSPRGVRAQFIVRYDVARELAAADFQVRFFFLKIRSGHSAQFVSTQC